MCKYFEVGDHHFGVRSTSAAFGEWLDHALHRYLVPTPADVRYSFVVEEPGQHAARAGRSFNIFYWGTVALVRTLHLPTVVDSFLTELESLLLPDRDDSVYMRAVPVAVGERAGLVPMSLVLALGDQSRMAKKLGLSISAAMAVELNVDSGLVGAIHPRLQVPEDAGSRLIDMGWAPGSPDRVSVTTPSAVDAIFTMVRGPEGPDAPLLGSASRAATLYRIAPWVSNFSTVRSRAVIGLGRMLRRSACYTLGSTGNPEYLLQSLADGITASG